jgi:4-oxalocrotonate tautomerase
MPIVQISFVEGRDPESIRRCVKAVARTVHETLGAPLETIRVFATGVPAAQWAVGDRTRDEIDAEKRATAQAAEASQTPTPPRS